MKLNLAMLPGVINRPLPGAKMDASLNAHPHTRIHHLLGTAQVDNIGTGKGGVIGKESILSRAGHVHNVFVLLRVRILSSSLSHHDRGIDVDGVGWILNGSHNIGPKDLLQPHNIALGTVTDKDFVGLNQTIVQRGGDLLSQVSHTLFGTVTRIAFLGS